jgi:lysophospholipase L1-like esterase
MAMISLIFWIFFSVAVPVLGDQLLLSFDENIQSVGRIFRTEKNSFQADWPNSGITFQFQANSNQASLNLSFGDCGGNCHAFVAIDVNCARLNKYEISPSTVVSSSFLTEPGQFYEVSLRKITEAHFSEANGILEFASITIDGGNALPEEDFKEICPKKKNILVFGDSFTAAYGVDQLDPCGFTAATEDVTHGYAYLAAQEVSADVHIIAWSGKGAVRNNGDSNPTSADPLPTYYNRTLANLAAPDLNTNYWDPKSFSPDLTIVMLGTNDYSPPTHPSDEQFVSGLSSFLKTIQGDYPSSKILALCAPGSSSLQCRNIHAAALAVDEAEYFEIPADVWQGGVGCSGHPYATTQQNMAAAILPTVQKLLQ